MLKCGITKTFKFPKGAEVDARGLTALEVLNLRMNAKDPAKFAEICILGGVVDFRGFADKDGKELAAEKEGETRAATLLRCVHIEVVEKLTDEILKMSVLGKDDKKK